MSTQNVELRQLLNSVEIIGTLKSKDIEVKKSGKGNYYMGGKLVVQSKFNGKVQEQVIKILIMQKSKLFKGIQTVLEEYKTIEKDGIENADRIKVTGELTLNEYYSSQGHLNSYNEIKGVFFNRLDDTNDQPDKAIASIETVVKSFTEKLDKDQLPTGEFAVNGYTVGWGNSVIELRECIIGQALAQPFIDLYQPGSTGRLSFQLNRYVDTQEAAPEEQAAPSHGFGSKEKVEGNTFTNYVNNIEIIGGDMPYFGSKEYTPEEQDVALQVRNLTLQALQEAASDTPSAPANTGFGAGSNQPPKETKQPEQTQETVDNNMPSGMGAEDMPDF